MEFTTHDTDQLQHITDLFKTTFTDSEGAAEGDLIAGFVEQLFATTDPGDIFVFLAQEAGALVGAVIFSRMRYPRDPRSVFLLSPMAVATEQQGRRTGQTLLAFALNMLRKSAVDIVLTYGDINFYSKVGFSQISQTTAMPPVPLTFPDGWLGQSLTDNSLEPLKGPSTCVEALNNPALW